MTEIHGHCDDAFIAVRDQFARNFDEGLEVGASVCITRDGENVVDLWAGHADSEGRPWEEDTLTNVWSTTKTMSAIVMLVLADRGLIDLDAPVAEYWPEFGSNGKEGVLVRHVLAHTAGLPGWDPAIRPEDIYDLDLCARNFEAQSPWWEPGTAQGYSPFIFGWILGELVRRVSGKSLGTFFRDEVAVPLAPDEIPADALRCPTFAAEVARGLPCAVTLACADESLGADLVHGLVHRALLVGDGDLALEDLAGVLAAGVAAQVVAAVDQGPHVVALRPGRQVGTGVAPLGGGRGLQPPQPDGAQATVKAARQMASPQLRLGHDDYRFRAGSACDCRLGLDDGRQSASSQPSRDHPSKMAPNTRWVGTPPATASIRAAGRAARRPTPAGRCGAAAEASPSPAAQGPPRSLGL